MLPIEELLRDADRAWTPANEQRVTLHILGSTALMLQADYLRGTSDSDVLETKELDAQTKHQLLALAGRGTELHTKHRIYIDVVANGIPFLPQVPIWHPRVLPSPSLLHVDVMVLDVVDVVVSKLAPFRTHDRDDIAAMIDRELVPHAEFVTRFRAAVDYVAYDARASNLPRYIDNFHQVERDLFGVSESDIDLPEWIDR